MEKLILFDQIRCIGCGLCVSDCPGKAIALQEEKAEYIHRCIKCGHCVAICPTNAVSIPEYDMEEVTDYDRDTFTVIPQNFLNAVKFRRSIRNFKNKQLEPDVLEHILDAGRYTETAKNTQGNTFVVIQNELPDFKRLLWENMPDLLAKMKESEPLYARVFSKFYEDWKSDQAYDSLFFNTPALLVISSKDMLDGGLSAANIENMAAASGVGVLFSGYLSKIINASDNLLKWLGVEANGVACCMLMGYPAVKYKRTAPRKKGNIELR